MLMRFLCKFFFLKPAATKKKAFVLPRMQSITAIMSEPKYAAGIAAAIAILAKWMDHRISNTKGTIGGYIKTALFSAGLVGFWVYMIRNPDKVRDAQSAYQSAYSSLGSGRTPSGGSSSSYSRGFGGGSGVSYY
jgi:hypothetical protein